METNNVQIKKQIAVAFIDFEYWMYALLNGFRMEPDVTGWAKEVQDSYEVTGFHFFGDFTQNAIGKELGKIRQVSNQIIETKNSGDYLKKDFTDFIILDAIYQPAMFSDVDVYILFTGDGHFTSVAAFLKNRLHKKVVVYGVRESFSYALKQAATEWHEIPSERSVYIANYKPILRYITYLNEHGNGFQPTFWNVIDAVSDRTGTDRQTVQASLRQLIDQEYIKQKLEWTNFHKQLKILKVDWEKAIADGIWNSEE